MRENTLVLEGEISRSASTLAVHVQLSDAGGAVTWSERFIAEAGELFGVEDVIAERVVTELNLRLAATDQARLRRRYTSNAAADEEYLRGRAALVKQTPDGALEAIRAFRGSLERDSEYALARAGLAMASADMYLRFSAASDVEQWGAAASMAPTLSSPFASRRSWRCQRKLRSGPRPPRGGQPPEQPHDRRYVPRARLLLVLRC